MQAIKGCVSLSRPLLSCRGVWCCQGETRDVRLHALGSRGLDVTVAITLQIAHFHKKEADSFFWKNSRHKTISARKELAEYDA